MATLTNVLNGSFLFGAEYNLDTLELTLFFRNQTAYVYQEVEYDVYDELIRAESAGVFYNDNIRHVFTGVSTRATFDINKVAVANLNSSFLSSAVYSRGVAHINYKNGKSYSYNIRRDCFNDFITAKSSGAYYRNYIVPHADQV